MLPAYISREDAAPNALQPPALHGQSADTGPPRDSLVKLVKSNSASLLQNAVANPAQVLKDIASFAEVALADAEPSEVHAHKRTLLWAAQQFTMHPLHAARQKSPSGSSSASSRLVPPQGSDSPPLPPRPADSPSLSGPRPLSLQAGHAQSQAPASPLQTSALLARRADARQTSPTALAAAGPAASSAAVVAVPTSATNSPLSIRTGRFANMRQASGSQLLLAAAAASVSSTNNDDATRPAPQVQVDTEATTRHVNALLGSLDAVTASLKRKRQAALRQWKLCKDLRKMLTSIENAQLGNVLRAGASASVSPSHAASANAASASIPSSLPSIAASPSHSIFSGSFAPSTSALPPLASRTGSNLLVALPPASPDSPPHDGMLPDPPSYQPDSIPGAAATTTATQRGFESLPSQLGVGVAHNARSLSSVSTVSITSSVAPHAMHVGAQQQVIAPVTPKEDCDASSTTASRFLHQMKDLGLFVRLRPTKTTAFLSSRRLLQQQMHQLQQAATQSEAAAGPQSSAIPQHSPTFQRLFSAPSQPSTGSANHSTVTSPTQSPAAASPFGSPSTPPVSSSMKMVHTPQPQRVLGSRMASDDLSASFKADISLTDEQEHSHVLRRGTGESTIPTIQEAEARNPVAAKTSTAAAASGAVPHLDPLKQAEELKQRQRETEGVIVYATPSARTLLGYDAGDMSGKRYLTFVHEEDRSKLHKALSKLACSVYFASLGLPDPQAPAQPSASVPAALHSGGGSSPAGVSPVAGGGGSPQHRGNAQQAEEHSVSLNVRMRKSSRIGGGFVMMSLKAGAQASAPRASNPLQRSGSGSGVSDTVPDSPGAISSQGSFATAHSLIDVDIVVEVSIVCRPSPVFNMAAVSSSGVATRQETARGGSRTQVITASAASGTAGRTQPTSGITKMSRRSMYKYPTVSLTKLYQEPGLQWKREHNTPAATPSPANSTGSHSAARPKSVAVALASTVVPASSQPPTPDLTIPEQATPSPSDSHGETAGTGSASPSPALQPTMAAQRVSPSLEAFHYPSDLSTPSSRNSSLSIAHPNRQSGASTDAMHDLLRYAGSVSRFTDSSESILMSPNSGSVLGDNIGSRHSTLSDSATASLMAHTQRQQSAEKGANRVKVLAHNKVQGRVDEEGARNSGSSGSDLAEAEPAFIPLEGGLNSSASRADLRELRNRRRTLESTPALSAVVETDSVFASAAVPLPPKRGSTFHGTRGSLSLSVDSSSASHTLDSPSATAFPAATSPLSAASALSGITSPQSGDHSNQSPLSASLLSCSQPHTVTSPDHEYHRQPSSHVHTTTSVFFPSPRNMEEALTSSTTEGRSRDSSTVSKTDSAAVITSPAHSSPLSPFPPPLFDATAHLQGVQQPSQSTASTAPGTADAAPVYAMTSRSDGVCVSSPNETDSPLASPASDALATALAGNQPAPLVKRKSRRRRRTTATGAANPAAAATVHLLAVPSAKDASRHKSYPSPNPAAAGFTMPDKATLSAAAVSPVLSSASMPADALAARTESPPSSPLAEKQPVETEKRCSSTVTATILDSMLQLHRHTSPDVSGVGSDSSGSTPLRVASAPDANLLSASRSAAESQQDEQTSPHSPVWSSASTVAVSPRRHSGSPLTASLGGARPPVDRVPSPSATAMARTPVMAARENSSLERVEPAPARKPVRAMLSSERRAAAAEPDEHLQPPDAVSKTTTSHERSWSSVTNRTGSDLSNTEEKLAEALKAKEPFVESPKDADTASPRDAAAHKHELHAMIDAINTSVSSAQDSNPATSDALDDEDRDIVGAVDDIDELEQVAGQLLPGMDSQPFAASASRHTSRTSSSRISGGFFRQVSSESVGTPPSPHSPPSPEPSSLGVGLVSPLPRPTTPFFFLPAGVSASASQPSLVRRWTQPQKPGTDPVAQKRPQNQRAITIQTAQSGQEIEVKRDGGGEDSPVDDEQVIMGAYVATFTSQSNSSDSTRDTLALPSSGAPAIRRFSSDPPPELSRVKPAPSASPTGDKHVELTTPGSASPSSVSSIHAELPACNPEQTLTSGVPSSNATSSLVSMPANSSSTQSPRGPPPTVPNPRHRPSASRDAHPVPYDPHTVIPLPRGGIVVKTSAGLIQFGMPPETIKDSMLMGLTVPTCYVMPKVLFDRERGINVAEFEFPAYFNFFILRKRVRLITTRAIAERVKAVFEQTLIGPVVQNDHEFVGEEAIICKPDLNKECGWFSKHPYEPDKIMQNDTMVEFIYFDDHGVAVVDAERQLEVHDIGYEYVLMDGGKETFRTPVTVEIPRILNYRDNVMGVLGNATPSASGTDTAAAGGAASGTTRPRHMHTASMNMLTRTLSRGATGTSGGKERRLHAFIPPMFGVTFLGASHGFDPQGTTTGFVLWINRRGCMVDPPPNSGALLRLYGIAPFLIDGVIVTHCHADHDAGTFHKILEDRRVTVLTTPTIMTSFLNKYSAISGIEVPLLQRLFVFRPVRIGEPIGMHGGEFRFFYSLHSIPCIGFECYYGGKSMIYSGDTMNDPTQIQQMFEEGTMTPQRRDFLLNFPFHHSLVLHEAGVPPIHTPFSTFERLSEEEKERLYIVHCSASSVPKDRGYNIAREGVAHSLLIQLDSTPPFAEAMGVLSMMTNLDIFSSLSLMQASSLLQCCSMQDYHPGAVITEAGEWSSDFTFYIIVSGVVEVLRLPHSHELERTVSPYAVAVHRHNIPTTPGSAQPRSEYLTCGDCFGHQALLYEEPQQQSVVLTEFKSPEAYVAVDRVICIKFNRFALRNILRGTDVLRALKRLDEQRNSVVSQDLVELLQLNSVFYHLSGAQTAEFRSSLKRVQFGAGDVIFRAGEVASVGVLIDSGVVELHVDHELFSLRRELTELPPRKLGRGAFIADLHSMLSDTANHPASAAFGSPSSKSGPVVLSRSSSFTNSASVEPVVPCCMQAVMRQAGVAYIIKAEALLAFFDVYPGLLISFLNTLFRV